MENEKPEDEGKTQINPEFEKKLQKYKIISNKFKNYLLNSVSYLINNKNVFEEKLKPSDFSITLETDSDKSTYNQFYFKTKFKYSSFNPKRDSIKNIKLFKSFPVEIEIQDEYYNRDYGNIIVNLTPKLTKRNQVDLSEFPLCSYENNAVNYNIKNDLKNILTCKDKEFILCIYLSNLNKLDKDDLPEAFKLIETVNETEKFNQYFNLIVIIIQVNNNKDINGIVNNEKIKKYFNNDKNKFIFLFDVLTNYEPNDKNKDNVINILGEKVQFYDDSKISLEKFFEINYFFILDNNKRIIKINQLKKIGELITFITLELEKYKNCGDNLSFFEKKEKKRKEGLNDMIKLITFITNIKKLNLNYIFDLRFKFSLKLIPNDELTEINLYKINQLFLEGEFFTKDYKYLKQICESIKFQRFKYKLEELATIDVDIDFSNMECGKCKKVIKEQEYLYYCYICKIKYCYDCVQNQLKNNKGKARYIDEKHNLLFFKTRDKNQFLNLEEIKLGKNRFVDVNENDLVSWNSTTCNGCMSTLKSDDQRYVCLLCRKGRQLRGGYVDYCSRCIKLMCENENEKKNREGKADEIIDGWSNYFLEGGFKFKVEHKHDKHIYLMMPYQLRTSEREYYFF